jgi:hypothetical protein
MIKLSIDLQRLPNYGINERIVAIESLESVLSIIKKYKDVIELLMNDNKISIFISKMDESTKLVKKYVLERSLLKIFNVQQYPNIISSCKWTDNDITENNKYINQLLSEFNNFKSNISKFDFNNSTYDIIFNFIHKISMEILVEGFSRIKKVRKKFKK